MKSFQSFIAIVYTMGGASFVHTTPVPTRDHNLFSPAIPSTADTVSTDRLSSSAPTYNTSGTSFEATNQVAPSSTSLYPRGWDMFPGSDNAKPSPVDNAKPSLEDYAYPVFSSFPSDSMSANTRDENRRESHIESTGGQTHGVGGPMNSPSHENLKELYRATVNAWYDENYGPRFRLRPDQEPLLITGWMSAPDESEYADSVPLDVRTYDGGLFQMLNLGVRGKRLTNVDTAGGDREWILYENEWHLIPGWYQLVENQIV